MAIELKRFNSINALYGFNFGNKTLYEAAKVICNTVGDGGSVYRVDGTVFAVVFNDLRLERIKEMYSQIRDSLANFSLDGSALNVEISGGALYTKNYEVSSQTIYSYLLSALEKAKEELNKVNE